MADLYLEEIEGKDALANVRQWNESGLALKDQPGFAANKARLLELLESPDKLPHFVIRGNGDCYNFWQDHHNVKGLLRRTRLSTLLVDGGDAVWEPILDVDALSDREGVHWVYKASINQVSGDRGMLKLSDGGKDAAHLREFNYRSKCFVPPADQPFIVPENKSSCCWVSDDELLLTYKWDDDDDDQPLTDSGYGRVVKRWQRGQPLRGLPTVFAGETSDVGVWPIRLNGSHHHGGGGPATACPPFALLVVRAVTFYETEHWLVELGGDHAFAGPPNAAPLRLPLPAKCDVHGYHKGFLIFDLQEEWGGFATGSLLSFSLFEFALSGATHVQLVSAPPARGTIESVCVMASYVVTVSFEQTSSECRFLSRLNLVRFDGQRWAPALSHVLGGGGGDDTLFPAQTGSISVVSHRGLSDQLVLTAQDFLSPPSLWFADLRPGAPCPSKLIKRLPESFDASLMAVEAFSCPSLAPDRFPVTYTVVRRRSLVGPAPTVVSVYGGFRVSSTPYYQQTGGPLTLERGGALVVAHVRGGGELGPNFHEAALKDKQVSLDDLAGVAKDLVRRGLATRLQIAIRGGSHGGFMVGSSFAQRPQLYGAVVCLCPLLDMLRFHLLPPGASWIAEYGDPEVPAEAAVLAKVSPYHVLAAGDGGHVASDYPPILFLLSTKDDRVHPGHARRCHKLLLEKGLAAGRQLYYFENIESGGHAVSSDLRKTAERLAMQEAFLSQTIYAANK